MISAVNPQALSNGNRYPRATKNPYKSSQRAKASVEGEAPPGFAGGGGDASPFNR